MAVLPTSRMSSKVPTQVSTFYSLDEESRTTEYPTNVLATTGSLHMYKWRRRSLLLDVHSASSMGKIQGQYCRMFRRNSAVPEGQCSPVSLFILLDNNQVSSNLKVSAYGLCVMFSRWRYLSFNDSRRCRFAPVVLLYIYFGAVVISADCISSWRVMVVPLACSWLGFNWLQMKGNRMYLIRGNAGWISAGAVSGSAYFVVNIVLWWHELVTVVIDTAIYRRACVKLCASDGAT